MLRMTIINLPLQSIQDNIERISISSLAFDAHSLISEHFYKSNTVNARTCEHLIINMDQVRKMNTPSIQGISLWLYFGNVPIQWKEKEIRELLQQFGAILEIKLVAKYSRFSGTAYVQFQSMTNANFAIQSLNDQLINGQKIILKWLDTEENRLGIGQNSDHKLFVGSLPRQATREDIYNVFSLMGEVQAVRLEQKQFWSFVDYKHKQSALLAIKHLHGQVYFHGSHIPIEVRFKERKQNSFMQKKHEKEELDPFEVIDNNIYCEVIVNQELYYRHIKTKKITKEKPPAGAKVRKVDGSGWYFVQQEHSILNDCHLSNKKFGPVGANLFLFHIPNNTKQSQIFRLFSQYGNIISVRIMTEKNGKPKGIGFVSYDSPASAKLAIGEMNGFELKGKRLKVQLNKKDELAIGKTPTQLEMFQII